MPLTPLPGWNYTQETPWSCNEMGAEYSCYGRVVTRTMDYGVEHF